MLLINSWLILSNILIIATLPVIYSNIQSRVLNLCVKYCNGLIPDTKHDPAFALPFDLESVVSHTEFHTFISLASPLSESFDRRKLGRGTRAWTS